jgi:tRNA (uracil-5-)-methyltransferase TRM9
MRPADTNAASSRTSLGEASPGKVAGPEPPDQRHLPKAFLIRPAPAETWTAASRTRLRTIPVPRGVNAGPCVRSQSCERLCGPPCVVDTRASSDGGVVTARFNASRQLNVNDPQRAAIADSYDRYYASGVYDARYPRPNPATFRSVLRLAGAAARVLDFGAGSGRYALPILHATDAFVCAYDISADACRAVERRATSAGVGTERLLTTPSLDAARSAGPYDLVISLFGVLSHIEAAEDRIDALNSMRSMLTGHGRLLLTVPNAVRRLPLHTCSPGQVSEGRGEPCLRACIRRHYPSARQVTYRHTLEDTERPFPYYLYSRRQLASELAAAGFALELLEADSVLPERKLVRSPALAPVDDFLRLVLPSWAGYGLRATCRAGRP